MALSYLDKPGSVTLDITGSGIISIYPDTNQFWLPNLVTVSNLSGLAMNCQLFSGGPAGRTDFSSLRDSTIKAQNDASSILSGTVVQHGQAIVFSFSGGVPGDVAFAEVFGTSSDVPPTLGITPEIPGARFAGAPNNAVIARTLISTGFTALAGNTTVPVSGGLYVGDSPFVGFLFECRIQGTATFTINWYTDQILSNLVAADTIDLNSTGGLTRFSQSIPSKGLFMTITVIPTGNPTVAIKAFTTSASATYPGIGANALSEYVFMGGGFFINSGANVTLNSVRTYAGPAYLYMKCVSNPPATVWSAVLTAIANGGLGTAILITVDNQNNATPIYPLLIPPVPLQMVITNNDVAQKAFQTLIMSKPFIG